MFDTNDLKIEGNIVYNPYWQPVDTAPKDGTWVLLCGGSYCDECGGKADVMIARWEPGNRLYTEGWLVCAAEAGYSCFFYEDPTHWMPIPRPPLSVTP